ncbi:hypothetical protein [Sandarakinorhabdus sp.]|uniref:hypothetical protein n=1 Tax=Sandarakinorhabdus sp. TaxID=1916663 RepID=UPI00286DC10D|nr:hypothetical protein [Sandarakinorhabdus sp.]
MHPARLFMPVVLAAGLVLSACSNIQLVSRYDETTDAGAAKLQRDLSSFFVGIDAAPMGDEATFAANQGFYKRAAIDVSALQARAAGLYKNAITIEQLVLVRDNLAWLALLHKGCVTAPLNAEQKEAVRQNGIDTSLDCRTDHGATADASGRGDRRLNPALLGVVHSLLDQQLGSVMALEMAKKRGQGG